MAPSCERPPTGDVRIRQPRCSTALPQPRPTSAGARPRTAPVAGESLASAAAGEEEISEEFLRFHSGLDDLEEVNRLELCVNSLTHNLEALGSMLPRLLHLKLSGSSISYMRELGTGLQQLEVVWLGGCGLQDVSGIAGTLPELRELYLPFNEVADLAPLSAHEVLEVLDLEGNAVHDLDEVSSLWMCTELCDLTLRHNPLCEAASYSHVAVLELLPQLAALDDVRREDALGSRPDARFEEDSDDAEPVAPLESLQAAHPTLALALLEASDKPSRSFFAEEPDEIALLLERVKEAPSGGQTLTTWLRPLERQHVAQAEPSADGSSKFRFENSMNLQESADTSSALTCGSSLSGNPLHAARQRRRRAGGTAAPEAMREGGLDIRSLVRRHRHVTGRPDVGEGDGSTCFEAPATPSSAASPTGATLERPQTAQAMEKLRQRSHKGAARRSASGPAGPAGASRRGAPVPVRPTAPAPPQTARPRPATPGSMAQDRLDALSPLPQSARSSSRQSEVSSVAMPPSAPKQAGQGRPVRRQPKAPSSPSRHVELEPVTTPTPVPPPSAPFGAPRGSGEPCPAPARPRRRPAPSARSHSAAPVLASQGDPYREVEGLAARGDESSTFDELLKGFALDNYSHSLGVPASSGKRRPGDAFFLERDAGGGRYLLVR